MNPKSELKDLLRLSDLPGVLSSVALVSAFLQEQLHAYEFTEQPDGFIFAQPKGTPKEAIKLVFTTHLDELGGLVLGKVGGEEYACWGWPQAFDQQEVQVFPYDATDEQAIRYGRAYIAEGQLRLKASGIAPYRYLFTYATKSQIEGDYAVGKAFDPRAAVYCLMALARKLARPDVGFLFVYGEESGSYGIRKAVRFLSQLPSMQLLVNCDVPSLDQIQGAGLEDASLRIVELQREAISPWTTLAMAETLEKKGVEFKLARSQTGSLTPALEMIAPCLSVAINVEGGHQVKGRISLKAVSRCIALLEAITDAYQHIRDK